MGEGGRGIPGVDGRECSRASSASPTSYLGTRCEDAHWIGGKGRVTGGFEDFRFAVHRRRIFG